MRSSGHLVGRPLHLIFVVGLRLLLLLVRQQLCFFYIFAALLFLAHDVELSIGLPGLGQGLTRPRESKLIDLSVDGLGLVASISTIFSRRRALHVLV